MAKAVFVTYLTSKTESFLSSSIFTDVWICLLQFYQSHSLQHINQNVLLVLRIGVNHFRMLKIVVHYVIVRTQFGVMMRNQLESTRQAIVNGVKRFSKIPIKAFNIYPQMKFVEMSIDLRKNICFFFC